MQQQKQIKLDELSLTELKALAYDQLVIKEQSERNISAINEQIRIKMNGEPQKVEETEQVN